MGDKILTEAFDKLKAIEESDEASRNRKMQRAFADFKDEMTDKLQWLTDKSLNKMKLSDDGYSWASAARPYKRGQGFVLSTRVSGNEADIKAFVARLGKAMAGLTDTIAINSMHNNSNMAGRNKLPSAWIHAKFPNKYATLSEEAERRR